MQALVCVIELKMLMETLNYVILLHVIYYMTSY